MTDVTPVEATPPDETATMPSTAVSAAAAEGPSDGEAVADSGTDPGRLAGVSAILIRELRGRMRGKRAFIFITVYLTILVGLFWAAVEAGGQFWTMGALESIGFGRGVFGAVMFIEALVIVALAPAYTAGLISSEHEKQTFDLLSATPISSVAIVLGKLLSGLSYLGLIVGASIPLASVAFLFGGVDVMDLVRGYFVLLVTGIGVGSIGVWCSAAMKKTQPATVAAFVITALLVLGASGSWIILEARAADQGTAAPPEALLYLNPFAAVSDVICQATGSGCFVAEGLARAANQGQTIQPLDVGPGPQVTGLGPGGVAAGACCPPNQQFGPMFAPPTFAGGDFWPKSVVAYILLTPIAMFAAAQSLSPTRRWNWPSRPRPQPLSPGPADD
jgi:ABC-type transport system involved in multi-copper enzyme maturation permease subunit